MRWQQVHLDPCPIPARLHHREWSRYVLTLPLLNDGRIAFGHLRARPQKAVVERFSPDHGVSRGEFRLVDNQATIVWPHAPWRRLEGVRVYADRFVAGENIALRPGHGPIRLYEVSLAVPRTIQQAEQAISLQG